MMPIHYFRAIHALSSALQHVNHIRPVITYLENHPPIEELLFHDLESNDNATATRALFFHLFGFNDFPARTFFTRFCHVESLIAMVQYHYFYWRLVSKTYAFNSPNGVTSVLLLLHPNITMTLFRS